MRGIREVQVLSPHIHRHRPALVGLSQHHRPKAQGLAVGKPAHVGGPFRLGTGYLRGVHQEEGGLGVQEAQEVALGFQEGKESVNGLVVGFLRGLLAVGSGPIALTGRT